ncbi:restriction endonuclease subunit S [Pseudoalteromonas sp. T1lg75]|uniref:restriction endonuclease subunit S n=1 Tax=Pseudoalteromonas sp. T1lg75 TaxID=2077102 RepID=UPI000CF685FF|nr:restriction endonuclease subunit S [Pseudoalteromonas sp. T1lg75]
MKQFSKQPKIRFPEFNSDWETSTLSNAILEKKEKSSVQDQHEILTSSRNGLVRQTDYYDGNERITSRENIGFNVISPGELTYRSRSDDRRFYFNINPFSFKGIISSYYPVFALNDVDSYFFTQLCSVHSFYIGSRSVGTSQTVLSLNELKKIKLPFPSIDEQQKISKFLKLLDNRLVILKEKYNLLVEYKKGVMQKLFNQEISFKDEAGNNFPSWKEERIGNWIEEYKERSTEENQFEVLTSSRTGLMKQSEYYGEGRITDRSNLGFNIIPNGYLTYRSRSDDRQFFFNLNELGYTGIISTYYPVFKMKNEQNKFFVELSRFHKNKFGRQAVGTSQVVLSFNELKNIKFAMPCNEEQAKIAEFAEALDKKLDAVHQQIELTQTFKKGLLQQMFV